MVLQTQTHDVLVGHPGTQHPTAGAGGKQKSRFAVADHFVGFHRTLQHATISRRTDHRMALIKTRYGQIGARNIHLSFCALQLLNR